MKKDFLKIISKEKTKEASNDITVSKSPSSKKASNDITVSKSPSSKTRSKLYNPYQKKWVPVSTEEGINLRKLIKQCEKCPKKGEYYDTVSKRCVSKSMLKGKDLEISDFCDVYGREMKNRSAQDIIIINNILDSKVEIDGGRFIPLREITNLDKTQLDDRIKKGDTHYAVLKIANAVGRIMKDNPRLGDKVRNVVLDNLKNVDKSFAAVFFTLFKKNIRGNIVNLFSYLSIGEITAIITTLFGAFWKLSNFLLTRFPGMRFWSKKVEKAIVHLQHDLFPSSTVELVIPNSDNNTISLLQQHNNMISGQTIGNDYVFTIPTNELGLTEPFVKTLGDKITILDYMLIKSGIFKNIALYTVKAAGNTFKISLGNDMNTLQNRFKNLLEYAVKGSKILIDIDKKYVKYLELNKERKALVKNLQRTKNPRDIQDKITQINRRIKTMDMKYDNLFSLYTQDKGLVFMKNPMFIKPIQDILENISEYNVNYYVNKLYSVDNDFSLIKLYTYIAYEYERNTKKEVVKIPPLLSGVKDADIKQSVSVAGVISQKLQQSIQNVDPIVYQSSRFKGESWKTIAENKPKPLVSLKGESWKTIAENNPKPNLPVSLKEIEQQKSMVREQTEKRRQLEVAQRIFDEAQKETTLLNKDLSQPKNRLITEI